MLRRLTVPVVMFMVLSVFAGCGGGGHDGRLTSASSWPSVSFDDDDDDDWLFDMAENAIKSAAGDNVGPLFTGESRGEYRDRKEVERLGYRKFRQAHGRKPDLYLAPHSNDW